MANIVVVEFGLLNLYELVPGIEAIGVASSKRADANRASA